jgi:hypothetical protein
MLRSDGSRMRPSVITVPLAGLFCQKLQTSRIHTRPNISLRPNVYAAAQDQLAGCFA